MESDISDFVAAEYLSYIFIMSVNTSNAPSNVRKPRKDARYSREEMTILIEYKEEYREQTTRELRANVIRTKILPRLYNFWVANGTGPKDENESENRMKVIQFPSGMNDLDNLFIFTRNLQAGSVITGAHIQLIFRLSRLSLELADSMLCGRGRGQQLKMSLRRFLALTSYVLGTQNTFKNELLR